MKTPEEVEQELFHVERAYSGAVEYREFRRLNNGYDVDFERVMGTIISVENEKRRLLKWVLGIGERGAKE